MAAITKTNNIHHPAYYAPDDSNIHHAKKDSLPIRVFYASLPFIALHRPFGKVITLTMDLIRTFSSFGQLIQQKNSKELFKTAVAISALAGTLFLHPIGLCISTLYDLGFDISLVITQLQTGHHQEACNTLLSMTQHLFYLGTMVFGSLEVIAVSMLLNMAMEISRSKKEFQKGNLLEGSSHLLMSMVRLSQSLPYIEKVAYKQDVKGKEYFRSLTETVAKIRNNAAMFFYSSARFFVRPHWKITEMWLETLSLYKDDQCPATKKTISFAKTTFLSMALLPFALGGLALGQTFHFGAFLLSTTPYIHLKGGAEFKKPSKTNFSVFQLNGCLTAGGFARTYGGVVLPNDQRAKKIADMIRKNNPDLVCLQEVSDLDDAYILYNELSKEYAEFYFNMGSTPLFLQNNSGLFVASKVAIARPELQSFSDIKGTEAMVNKCFFLFSTEIGDFITTHLSPSSNDLKPTDAEIRTRAGEQERIFLAAEQRASENNKPIFVLGDFNINWNSSEYKTSLLFREGMDQYNKGRQIASDQAATCETDFLTRRNWHHEKNAKPEQLILDYFLSFFHRPVLTKTQKIATFDTENPKQAISDHAALITNIDVTEN